MHYMNRFIELEEVKVDFFITRSSKITVDGLDFIAVWVGG